MRNTHGAGTNFSTEAFLFPVFRTIFVVSAVASFSANLTPLLHEEKVCSVATFLCTATCNALRSYPRTCLELCYGGNGGTCIET